MSTTQLHTTDPSTSSVPRTPKSYEEIASGLPEPVPAGGENPPTIATELTIPGEHLEAPNLPYNGAELDWHAWRSKYATISALYVLAARVSDKTKQTAATHLLFSPPQDEIKTTEDIDKWRDEAIQAAKDCGLKGGVVVFHGFRVNKDVTSQLNSHIESTPYQDTATDVLTWEWLRQGMNWRAYTEWGPHFHIVGLGKHNRHRRGPGLVKTLREFPEFSSENRSTQAISEHRSVGKDMLDHATFVPGTSGPPMHWFGNLEGHMPGAADEKLSEEGINEIRSALMNKSTHETEIRA